MARRSISPPTGTLVARTVPPIARLAASSGDVPASSRSCSVAADVEVKYARVAVAAAERIPPLAPTSTSDERADSLPSFKRGERRVGQVGRVRARPSRGQRRRHVRPNHRAPRAHRRPRLAATESAERPARIRARRDRRAAPRPTRATARAPRSGRRRGGFGTASGSEQEGFGRDGRPFEDVTDEAARAAPRAGHADSGAGSAAKLAKVHPVVGGAEHEAVLNDVLRAPRTAASPSVGADRRRHRASARAPGTPTCISTAIARGGRRRTAGVLRSAPARARSRAAASPRCPSTPGRRRTAGRGADRVSPLLRTRSAASSPGRRCPRPRCRRRHLERAHAEDDPGPAARPEQGVAPRRFVHGERPAWWNSRPQKSTTASPQSTARRGARRSPIDARGRLKSALRRRPSRRRCAPSRTTSRAVWDGRLRDDKAPAARVAIVSATQAPVQSTFRRSTFKKNICGRCRRPPSCGRRRRRARPRRRVHRRFDHHGRVDDDLMSSSSPPPAPPPPPRRHGVGGTRASSVASKSSTVIASTLASASTSR